MNATLPAAADRPRLGLALGGGAARGWAHIGVLRALSEAGIEPGIVAGTSIGALVGAAYVTGHLDSLEEWICGLTLQGVVSYLDLSLNGGVIKGEKLIDFLRNHIDDREIGSLAQRFGAVATDLATGREVWLREGLMLDAVRASIALPGLFTPVRQNGRLLVDGGLVNPVPVSLCRALGAEVVIAVDLASDILGRHLRRQTRQKVETVADSGAGGLRKRMQDSLGAWLEPLMAEQDRMPSMFDILASSINIMQVRISRSRLAGDPPDVLVTPRLAHLGLLEFHRAGEAIAEGRRAVAAILPQLHLDGRRDGGRQA